nr:hypothetical protein GCM10017547_04540 [Pseudarthrobacter oxydans]
MVAESAAPGVEGSRAELGRVSQSVNKPVSPGHEFLEARLGVVGFADADLGGDGVGAQEHPVEAHSLQRRLGQRPHKTLREASESAAEAVQLNTFGLGPFLQGVDPWGR